jgi:hypothetical protein
LRTFGLTFFGILTGTGITKWKGAKLAYRVPKSDWERLV